MKRLTSLFILCCLLTGVGWGQGVCSYVKSDTLTAVTATIVRPFEAGHSIIYTYGSGSYAYITLSDANGVLHKAALPKHVRLKDIRVQNDMVYCCGTNTSTGQGLIGYFQATELTNNILSATWLAIPDIQYVDNVGGATGIYYSTFCVKTFEIVDNNSAFPHMIFLGEMEANGDTIAGLSEIVTVVNSQRFASLFTPNDVEHYHDLALTDNYVYSVSVKGSPNHSNYLVRQMPRNNSMILQNMASSFPSYVYETRDEYTVLPDSLLIEAGGGDDFLVAYHSGSTVQPVVEMDFFSSASFAQTPPVSLWSASLVEVGSVALNQKMYDLRYNANQSAFNLLHAVGILSSARMIVARPLLPWTASYVNGCQLLSIWRDNAQGRTLMSGYRLSDGSLVEGGEMDDATQSCRTQETARATERAIVSLSEHPWTFGFISHPCQLFSTPVQTAVETETGYMCKKAY